MVHGDDAGGLYVNRAASRIAIQEEEDCRRRRRCRARRRAPSWTHTMHLGPDRDGRRSVFVGVCADSREGNCGTSKTCPRTLRLLSCVASACIPHHPQDHGVNGLLSRLDLKLSSQLAFCWGYDRTPAQSLFRVALYVYRRSGMSTAASEVVLRCNIHVSSFITSTSSSLMAWRFVTEATSSQQLLGA